MSDEDSVGKIIFLSLIRMVVILVALGLVLAVARIVQMIVGREIVQEEEVVVVHEYATEEEAAAARAAQEKESKKTQ